MRDKIKEKRRTMSFVMIVGDKSLNKMMEACDLGGSNHRYVNGIISANLTLKNRISKRKAFDEAVKAAKEIFYVYYANLDKNMEWTDEEVTELSNGKQFLVVRYRDSEERHVHPFHAAQALSLPVK